MISWNRRGLDPLLPAKNNEAICEGEGRVLVAEVAALGRRTTRLRWWEEGRVKVFVGTVFCSKFLH